jgi:hypothetical protein
MIYSPEGVETDIACFNITFADKFGYKKEKDKKMRELDFLRQQFIIVQEYIHETKEKSQWQIYGMNDLKTAIHICKG